MVDVLVTTAGGIEEDFIKCMGHTYMGDFQLKGTCSLTQAAQQGQQHSTAPEHQRNETCNAAAAQHEQHQQLRHAACKPQPYSLARHHRAHASVQMILQPVVLCCVVGYLQARSCAAKGSTALATCLFPTATTVCLKTGSCPSWMTCSRSRRSREQHGHHQRCDCCCIGD